MGLWFFVVGDGVVVVVDGGSRRVLVVCRHNWVLGSDDSFGTQRRCCTKRKCCSKRYFKEHKNMRGKTERDTERESKGRGVLMTGGKHSSW